jgi:hypothetical protein
VFYCKQKLGSKNSVFLGAENLIRSLQKINEKYSRLSKRVARYDIDNFSMAWPII